MARRPRRKDTKDLRTTVLKKQAEKYVPDRLAELNEEIEELNVVLQRGFIGPITRRRLATLIREREGILLRQRRTGDQVVVEEHRAIPGPSVEPPPTPPQTSSQTSSDGSEPGVVPSTSGKAAAPQISEIVYPPEDSASSSSLASFEVPSPPPKRLLSPQPRRSSSAPPSLSSRAPSGSGKKRKRSSADESD